MELRACVDALKPQLLSTLRQNIRIPSVQGDTENGAPYGTSVRDSLVHVLDTARKLGFRTENMDGHLGWCEYGDGDEMVAVLGHLDVVPAGDGWSCDPFGGELRDEKNLGQRHHGRQRPRHCFPVCPGRSAGFRPSHPPPHPDSLRLQ